MSQPPAHSGPPRYDVSRQDGTATIHVVGALDLATVPVLDNQLAELRDAGFRRLILDFRGLDFIDSTGLRGVLKHDEEARQDGFSIGLIQGPAAVRRVFELTGATDHLPFIDA